MPKLNTFFAAALAASTMITPVSAGDMGPNPPVAVYSGYAGHSTASAQANASASSYGGGYASAQSSAQASARGYGAQSSASASASATASGNLVAADDIVCVMGEEEIPCELGVGKVDRTA